MTNLSSWLSDDTVQTLGWTLVHFLWQGAGLAIILYVALAFCRSSVARYGVGLGALVVMATAPFVTFFMLSHSELNAPLAARTTQAVEAVASSAPMLSESVKNAESINWLGCFVLLWCGGVLACGIRPLGGWLLLDRLRRQATHKITGDLLQRCLELQKRMGLTSTVDYFQSSWADSPAVMGWFRPVVLLPVTALTGLSSEQLEMVIVHELAHIRRFDTFVNLFQILVETVLFYHPAVWWVSRLVRAERENCCDDVAVSLCGDAFGYVKALTIMEQWRATPAFVLAANSGSLKARAARLLGLRAITVGAPRAGLIAVAFLCAAGALLAGGRLRGTFENFTTATSSEEEQPAESPMAQETTQPPDVVPAPAIAPDAPPATPLTIEPIPKNIDADEARIAAGPMVDVTVSPQPVPAPHIVTGNDVNVKIHLDRVFAQVTRQIARAANRAAEGAEIDVDSDDQDGESSSARPQTSNPKESYITQLESAGYKNLSVDELISLKVQGVTPQYIKGMKDAGLRPTVEELIAMKVQGVTPEYIRDMRATGLNPSLSEIISMRVQGVTPEYMKKVQTQSGNKLTVGDVISMRIQGVEPTDAGRYEQLGLKDVSVHELIGMRIQGVTPDYVQAMQAAGYTSNSSHDFISAKIQGVTPEFVEQVRSHGFSNLTPHKIVQLKIANIF